MEGGGPGSGASGAPAVLGKLTLLGQIGEGGMARIFLARARGIGGFEKLVVVKQILPRLAEDAEFIARFFQEARLAATLDHPNIASVYDVDQEGDSYFYSMEYVRGRDLQKVMRRAQQQGRRLTLDEIVAIVGGLCAGLHHAHTRLGPDGEPLGIVHRDVSPSNVLLSFDGAVKLADFGVAKARTGMVSTEVGTLRGKIGYMSPEQCRGEAIDRRSDVYAVGVLLWEMLTGHRLHHGESEVAIIHRIAREEAPSPRILRPDVPDDLERIVAKALARGPAQRYASAHALQADLEEHARQHKLATSARTVAALVCDLFGNEPDASEPVAREPTTMRYRAPGERPLAGEERGTLPTETVAPLVLPASASLEELGLEEDDEHAPARGRRSSWAGVAVGLTLGIVLGGGGLYGIVAGPESPRDAAAAERGTETERAPAAAGSLASSAAAGERPVGASVASPGTDASPAPVTPTSDAPAGPAGSPSPNPGPSEASPASTPSSTTDDELRDDSTQPATKRRKSRRRRSTSATPRKIDLDSPLPPG